MTGPPNAERGPARGPVLSYDQQLEARSYRWGASGSPTLAFLASRERVLGRRRPRGDELVLDRDVATAADLLLEELGGPMAARAWSRALVRELEVASW